MSGIDERAVGHHFSSHRVPYVGTCPNSAPGGTWSKLDRYQDVCADRLGDPRDHLSIIGTKSKVDFYTAGHGITPLQNGLAIAGDFLSAGGVPGLRRAHLFDGFLTASFTLSAF
jgi:hypothetical protein